MMSEKVVPPTKFAWLASIAKVIPTLCVLALMGCGWFLVHRINELGQSPLQALSVDEKTIEPNLVTLPSG